MENEEKIHQEKEETIHFLYDTDMSHTSKYMSNDESSDGKEGIFTSEDKSVSEITHDDGNHSADNGSPGSNDPNEFVGKDASPSDSEFGSGLRAVAALIGH